VKTLIIMLLAIAVSGCDGVLNTSEIRDMWERCDAKFVGGCSLSAVPNSIPEKEIKKLIDRYTQEV